MSAPTTRNVTRAYRAADAETRAAGERWYPDALALARELDPHNVPRAAGVIAALSPRLQWTANARAARRAYADGHASGVLGCNARKADAILAGAVPLTVLRGHKVRAFYACIMAAGATDAVAVDMHAYDVAVGYVATDRERDRALARVGGYEAVARCYVRAARILSRELGRTVYPAEVQAVTWCHWRATTFASHDSARRSAHARARLAVAA